MADMVGLTVEAKHNAADASKGAYALSVAGSGGVVAGAGAIPVAKANGSSPTAHREAETAKAHRG